MHYVIGDVHGCMKELKLLVNKIKSQDKDAIFYFLGDFLDKGPAVYETMEWVAKNITVDGNYRSVRGNHEQDAFFWYRDSLIPWYENRNSGSRILPKTDTEFSDIVSKYYYDDPTKLAPFMDTVINKMPYNMAIDILDKAGNKKRYRLCHAWHSFDKNMTEVQRQEINMYGRTVEDNEYDEIIVHGHTPTISDYYVGKKRRQNDRPGLICYRKNAINLDGGCSYFKQHPNYACMLCGICLETLEEFYPYSVEERIRQGARLLADNPDSPMSRFGEEAIFKINMMRYNG